MKLVRRKLSVQRGVFQVYIIAFMYFLLSFLSNGILYSLILGVSLAVLNRIFVKDDGIYMWCLKRDHKKDMCVYECLGTIYSECGKIGYYQYFECKECGKVKRFYMQ